MSVKLTPLGSEPQWESVGVGEPVVVTVNDPADPMPKAVVLALVIARACAVLTVSVKLWAAFGVTPLAAVMVNG